MTDFIPDERFYDDLRERNNRGLRDVVNPKRKPAEYPQREVTCRRCGASHAATICPTCKEPTEKLLVIRPAFVPHFKTFGFKPAP